MEGSEDAYVGYMTIRVRHFNLSDICVKITKIIKAGRRGGAKKNKTIKAVVVSLQKIFLLFSLTLMTNLHNTITHTTA